MFNFSLHCIAHLNSSALLASCVLFLPENTNTAISNHSENMVAEGNCKTNKDLLILKEEKLLYIIFYLKETSSIL